MDIEMSDIDRIKDELQDLTKRSVRTETILERMEETQKLMAQVLDNQSRQKEKNLGFDTSIHRLNRESIKNREDIDANKDLITENKIGLAVSIAKSAAINAPAAGILVGLLDYASKHFVG